MHRILAMEPDGPKKIVNNRENPLIPWSYWIWLLHSVFVGSLYLYMFTPYKPDWFKMIFSSVSLGQETNYAVWWSGICLFIASQLFYKLASLEHRASDRWKWIILSAAMLAFAYDEIGSLHEMVSKLGGWKALAPFALIFIVGFTYALVALFKQRKYRFAGILILLGLAVFVAVVSLEFVEHNIRLNKYQQRSRLIFEEGAELFAMSLIIIAGLVSLKKVGINNRRLSEVIGNPPSLMLHHPLVFALFAIQFIAIAAFAIPNSGLFSEGNPASVFPIILFFTLSLVCFRIGRMERRYLLWWSFTLIFLFTSLCQIHSFISLLNKLALNIQLFTEPLEIWLITLLPLALLCAVSVYNGWVSLKQLLPDAFLFGVIALVLYPNNYSGMTYHLFSGCSAYLCYRLICHYHSTPVINFYSDLSLTTES